jgi:hypothetical protein
MVFAALEVDFEKLPGVEDILRTTAVRYDDDAL